MASLAKLNLVRCDFGNCQHPATHRATAAYGFDSLQVMFACDDHKDEVVKEVDKRAAAAD